MKRFFLFLALLMPLALSAQTAKTRAALQTQIDTSLASGQPITALMLRTVLKDMNASYLTPLTDGTFAAAVHTHAASDVSSGVFAVGRLGSGSPSSANFLRGDGVWTVIPGGGDMLNSQNLSALTNFATARTNLGLGNVDNTSDATKNVATATFTNKRVTKRVTTPASAATITPNADTSDIVKVNALTHNTTIATPTGTPTEGQSLMIELRASGGDRTVNFSSDFRIPSSSALTLPVTVLSGTKTKFMFTRDNDSAKWDFAAAVSGY